MPALGIADTGNLFGALEFSEKMVEKGIQPIVGCQVAVDFADLAEESRPGAPARGRPLTDLVLIAATEAGYWNLVRLVSDSYMQSEADTRAHVGFDALAARGDGLIVLTGGPGGPVNKALVDGQAELAGDAPRPPRRGVRRPALCRAAAPRHRGRAGGRAGADRHGLSARPGAGGDQRGLLPEARRLRRARRADRHRRGRGDRRGQPAAADAGALFQDARRDGRRCSRTCPRRPRTRSRSRCAVRGGRARSKPILPRFAGAGADPEEADRAEALALREAAAAGLARRLAAHGLAPGFSEEDYRKRLDYELGVIEKMKYPGYFLIVADFIQWAKAQGIPVGPGRGSGAGSLVAWALTITDLDPLRFNLIFERFLNPDRVSMPDFDVDFCQNRRDEVIQYVQQKYGADQVAQIITFGTLQARAVLRDVGRVLQMPYGQVDRLAKMVPANPANPVTLAQAVASEPQLQAARDSDETVARLLEIAMKLEGLYRHASTHAAGIVIGDRPLSQLVPLYRDPRSGMTVSQFNMKWVEQAGLVKFDFLGLKTLTVLDVAVKLIRRRGIEIDLSRIPLDDAGTFEMLTARRHGRRVPG